MRESRKVSIVEASLDDYPTIQNMARFYVYDMSRYCGHISSEWAIPKNGLYECFDFKVYFEDIERKAYLIKVDEELAGFVLLNKCSTTPSVDWNKGEFFILAKFQGTGLSRQVTELIWSMHYGLWEVSVIPENIRGLAFWRKAISQATKGKYSEEIKIVDYDPDQPKRYIFNFRVK